MTITSLGAVAALLFLAAACDDAPDLGQEGRRRAFRVACEAQGGFALFVMQGKDERRRACLQKMKVASP